MRCDHRDGKNCTIAARLAGVESVATATDAACDYCTAHVTPPRGRNKVTCDLAFAALRFAGRVADAMALIRSAPDIYPPGPSNTERLQAIESGVGVGSHLWRLLSSLGVKHTPTCSCLALAEEMNALGPAGCRRERTRLVAAMRHNAKSYGWGTVATAAAKAVTTGVAWRLKLTDVYGSLLDEAIRRAGERAGVSPPVPGERGGVSPPVSITGGLTPARSPIDILIPLGRGSRHDDLELRYALRSIDRHARGVRRIWIVGAVPPWLHETDQVRLVPREEAHGNKAYRIAAKVEWACRSLDLTKTFAFWNDDYLLTQDLDIRNIPTWYHGELFRGKESEGWQALLNHTGEALHVADRPAKHYDIHVPMLIDRQQYLALAAWWGRSRADSAGGYTMKSIYGNHYCDATAVPYPDAKLAGQWPTRIDQLCADRPVISYGDEALRAGFADWMAGRWPDPHPAEQTVIAVLGTFRGGTSCVAGLLHALNVDMGSGWPSPRRTNPRGTFEDAALAKLCRRAFHEPTLTERMPPARRIRRLRRWLRRRTAGVSPPITDTGEPWALAQRVFGAKHPTLCLCVPQLLAAWPAVRLIVVDRPVAETVASIGRAMRSWSPAQAEINTRRLIETRDRDLAADGRPVLRLNYHDVLADPAAAVDQLIAFCRLQVSSEIRQRAIASIDPALQTVRGAE